MIRNLTSLIFIIIALYSSANVSLHSPYNWENKTSDFYFICQCDEEYSELTLEISTNSDFENIVFSNSSRWLTVKEVWRQMPISPKELGNGTYCWRIKYDNEYTNSMWFTISDQVSSNSDYVIKRDKNEYPPIKLNNYEAPMVLSSLWIRSENTNNGLCQYDKGTYNRGIALKDNIIYISHLDYFNNIPHLKRYNAETGETLDSIFIDYGDFDKPQRALSYIDVDDAGNIYTINEGYIISGESGQPLFVDRLNILDGIAKVTGRYACNLPSASTSSEQTIKYAKVIGDVSTGNFTLYSALESNNNTSISICRWTFPTSAGNPNLGSKKFTVANPASTRIYPLNASQNYYIFDNSTILPTICKGNTNKGDFTEESSFNVTSDVSGNGLHIFNHGTVPMMIYGCNFKKEGSKFELITLHPNFLDGSTNQIDTFKGIKNLWKFPTNSLGNITPMDNTTIATSITTTTANNYPQTNLYIYSAGNGLAAYQLSHYTTTNIDNILNEDDLDWYIENQLLTFSNICNNIEVYNIYGHKIAKYTNSQKIDISNLQKGIYIITANDKTFKIIL